MSAAVWQGGDADPARLLRGMFHTHSWFVIAACLLLLWATWHSYRRLGLPFLRVWSVGWGCYAAARFLTWLQLGPLLGPPASPSMAVLSASSQTLYYLHAALVLSSLLHLLGRSRWQWTRTRSTVLVSTFLVLSVAVTWISRDDATLRAWLRVGVRSFVTTLVFAWCGLLLLGHGRSQGRLGAQLAGVALLALATVLAIFGLSLTTGRFSEWMSFVGVAEVFAVVAIGIGLVLWMQEDHAEHAERARQELAKRNTDLQRTERLHSLGQLAGGIAHHFHNVMTVIVGALDELRAASHPGEPMRAVAADARLAADRATTLTRRLLAVARDSAGPPRSIDLQNEVRELGSLLSSLAGHGMQLTMAIGSEPLPVRLQPGQVEQVLLNLVSNARDASAGRGELRIRLERCEDPRGPRARLSAEDHGVGMDAATVQRVGEPFFSTKGHSGTGLGMASVRGILASTDGELHISSAIGRGTTVTVSWPLCETVVPRVAAQGGSAVALLFVDDDDAIRRTVERALQRAGVAATVVDSGAAALQRLAADASYRLLVTDVRMPGMNGLALAHEVARRHPQLPIRFVTGCPEDVLAAGHSPQDVLTKPFTREQLLAFVAAVLGTGASR